MEILHFCASRSYSGLEQYAFQMALDQKKRGRAVGFVVAPQSELERRCREADIETLSFGFLKWGDTVRFWLRLRKILKENTLKIIHLHSTQEVFRVNGLFFLKTLFGSGRPKIILQTHIWINHSKQDIIHRLIYSLVDEVWCSSGPARESLLKNLPVKAEKIKIVNYGRDVKMLQRNFLSREEARRRLGLPPDATVLVSVSRLEKSKGIREFLEAALPLLTENQRLHLSIIGGPSPDDFRAQDYFQSLTALIDGLGSVKDKIHMHGMVTDSYKYLKAFDVYVLPSYEECFSLSLLDAQLAGLPVVGSRSGGTPEIVRDGLTGWLFNPRDVLDLRSKISAAVSHRELWQVMGQKAESRVRAEFDQQTVFDSIWHSYQR